MYFSRTDFSLYKVWEVLIYLRKSRSDDPSLTVEEVLERHETRLQEWAEANLGERIPEENIFREVVSGETIDARPEMLRLLSMIESPKFKAVLIIEPQRLSRGDLEDAGRIIKIFRYTNTLILTPPKPYDLRDDYDRDFFERELKRGNEYLEYQKRIMVNGREHSAAHGNFIGSVAPYGYDKAEIKIAKKKCYTLTENKEEADVVRLIFDLYVNQNLGYAKIALRLGELNIKTRNGKEWNVGTIADLLSNVHYIGKIRYNSRKTVKIVKDGEIKKTRPHTSVSEQIIAEGKHAPIISDELFQAAQAKKGLNPPIKKSKELVNPFAGILKCRCGKAMIVRRSVVNGKEVAAPRLVCGAHVFCKTASCVLEDFQNQLVPVLKNCIEDFELKLKADDGDSRALHLKLVANLEKKLDELNKLELSQWEKYSLENMPKHVFETLNEKVLREKAEVQEALCNAKTSIPDPVDYEERIARFSEALEALTDPSVSAAQKNALLKVCVEKIVYSRERVNPDENGVKRRNNGAPMEIEIFLKS